MWKLEACKRGVTLIEVMVSIGIFAVVTLAFLPWFQQSGRMGKEVAHEVTAKNIAQGILETMLADNYSNITLDNYPDPGVDYYIDNVNGILAAVTVEIEGYGMASNSSTANSLVDESALWDADRWKGSTVSIVAGTGRGERAFILGNDSNSLTITTNLSGSSSQGWSVTPDHTSQYVINGGKTVTIKVSWQYRGKDYERKIAGLVPFYVSAQ